MKNEKSKKEFVFRFQVKKINKYVVNVVWIGARIGDGDLLL